MKSYIFDTAYGTNFNKKKTPLKHANQFALFSILVSHNNLQILVSTV